jgi:hypothetical protein
MWSSPGLMDLIFFFQFQLSTLDLLEKKLRNFFYFFMKLSRSYDLGHRFYKLTRVYLSCFFLSFLIDL